MSLNSHNDLSRVWLATEIQKNKGRGSWIENEFEFIAQDSPVTFSAVEVLRERLCTQGRVGKMFSNGLQIQEAKLVWDGNEAQWCVSIPDKEYEACVVVEFEQLHWHALCIEDSSFWTSSEGVYTEIVPLRGIEDPSIDIRLRTLADLSLEGQSIPKHVSLREWCISASAARIFLARPEYAAITILDFAHAYMDGEELGAVLQTAWNRHFIQEISLDGIPSVPASIVNSFPNLQRLYARGIGWEHIDIPKGMTVLDVRENPILSCVGDGLVDLEFLGIDESLPQLLSCASLRSLHVHNVNVTHIPSSIQELSCVSCIGEMACRSLPDLRRLVVPYEAGLPNSPKLVSICIVGGEWTSKSISDLLIRYPKLSSLCICDAAVEADALLSLASLQSIAFRNSGLDTLIIPNDASWKYLDISENTNLFHIDWDGLDSLKQLVVSHTNIPLNSIAHCGSLMGLQYLGADGVQNVECLCAANALVGLQKLSLRESALPVLDFIANQALISLEEVDLGANKRMSIHEDNPNFLPRIRVDVGHPQEDDIRWLWRKKGHADIFHHNKLYTHAWWR